VEGAVVKNDIKIYLGRQLSDPKFKNWKAELKEEVGRKLSSQADGM